MSGEQSLEHTPSQQLPEPSINPEIEIKAGSMVLLIGSPGTGKSTFARRHFPPEAIISSDSIRQELSNNPDNQLVSRRAFQIATRIAQERLSRGEIAVIDANNITEFDRKSFIDAAQQVEASVDAIVFDTDLATCLKRVEERGRVSETVARIRYNMFRDNVGVIQHDDAIDDIHFLDPVQVDQAILHLPGGKGVSSTTEVSGEKATGYIPQKREQAVHQVEGGSVLYIERDGDSEGTYQNFMSHQVIDAEPVASRIGADPDDPAVAEVMAMFLAQRVKLNLTTAVRTPTDWPHREVLEGAITAFEEKRELSVPRVQFKESELEPESIQIVRPNLTDEPLLIVADIHGCLTALKDHVAGLELENEDRVKRGLEPRGLIFVGDMADRGPYDAEAVRYITDLVDRGKAILIRGNHDDNLLKELQGKDVQSKETQATAAALRELCDEDELLKIERVLSEAPYIKSWKGVSVGHGGVTHVPREGEELTDYQKMVFLKGQRTGNYIGGRQEIHPLGASVAHDPDQLVVGGHSHTGKEQIDYVSGTAVLDMSVELKGRLLAMRYPELSFSTTEEPSVCASMEVLKQRELPQGEALLDFIDNAERFGFVERKWGTGEYEGLQIVTYSRLTDHGNMWKHYPSLRNFRGLIVDEQGEIIARPFEKTHKAQIEVPLDKLEVPPERVYEKANGTLAITYHWKGQWRVATKFSFENEDYTKPAEEILEGLNTDVLDPGQTYLFELLLPEDRHIVEYEGDKELILLNSIDPKTGRLPEYGQVQRTAEELGVRSADDMIDQFPDMTIADIYRYAQTPGTLPNLEGLMAVYRDEAGEEQVVKVKVFEYDERKFVRDRLEWDKLIEKYDFSIGDIPATGKALFLARRAGSEFVRDALDARIDWIREESARITEELRAALDPLIEIGQQQIELAEGTGEIRDQIGNAMRSVAKEVDSFVEKLSVAGQSLNKSVALGLIRAQLLGDSNTSKRIGNFIKEVLTDRIERETEKRGKAAYWLIPEDEVTL